MIRKAERKIRTKSKDSISIDEADRVIFLIILTISPHPMIMIKIATSDEPNLVNRCSKVYNSNIINKAIHK